jgi:hypothetical protein
MQPNSVARERIMKARAKMLIKHPFFAVLMMGMEMVIDRHLPDGSHCDRHMKTLWINPAFVETINDDVLMFVLAHEIDHAAKKHCLRRGGREALRVERGLRLLEQPVPEGLRVQDVGGGADRRALPRREQVRDVRRPHLQHPR